MFRLTFQILAVFGVAAFVWGGAPALPVPEVERARRLHRDRDLIESLVDKGLELAGEEDPLQRAAQCSKLADRLAREIRHAGVDRDGPRVADLGRHLKLVLERGVADNLRIARKAIVTGSPRERTLLEFSTLAKGVESQLDRVPNTDAGEMTPALDAARQGREEVEKAIRGQSKRKDKTNREKP